jgi:hypothetical protein
MIVDPDVAAAATVVTITILVFRYYHRYAEGGAAAIDTTRYLTVAIDRVRVAMNSRAARREVRRIVAERRKEEEEAEDDGPRRDGRRERDPLRPFVTGIFIHPGERVVVSRW